VPAKKRRSPGEKKQLSYSRDRRNAYGENDKSSRKNIPRGKRRRHRVRRHLEHQLLAAAMGPVDEDAEMLVHDQVTARRHGYDRDWKKCPDTPLGVWVAFSLRQRVDRGMSAASTEQGRIEKVLRQTDLRKAPVGDREFAARLRG
jgi:hypothetical protein